MYKTMICAAAFAAMSSAWADDKTDVKLPANDKEFVIHMATCGHAEVKFSELADKNAADARVKEFAARLVKDHKAVNEKLAEHAKNQGVAVAAGFERDKRDTYTNLSKLNGADFDKAYVRQMVDDHEKAVQVLEHCSKNAMDPLIRKFCEETLPTVKEHLKQAKELQTSIK